MNTSVSTCVQRGSNNVIIVNRMDRRVSGLGWGEGGKMGLIISRAEASCLPKKPQTLVELKRKTGCEPVSILPT